MLPWDIFTTLDLKCIFVNDFYHMQFIKNKFSWSFLNYHLTSHNHMNITWEWIEISGPDAVPMQT